MFVVGKLRLNTFPLLESLTLFFDDNALYKHPEILELRDLSEEDPTEIEASKHDLS